MGIVLGAGLLVSFLYGHEGQPILRDRAYFTYVAQVAKSGEPLYGATTLGYPPYPTLATAMMMSLGELADVADYLMPRVLGVAMLLAASLLLYLLVRHLHGSELVAVLASLCFTGIGFLAILSVASAEPKMMLVVAMLGAALALESRRPLLAGAAAGIAVMSWQPGIVVPAALIVRIMIGSDQPRPRALARFMFGCLLGVAPGLVWIVTTGQLSEFFYQAVLRKLETGTANGSLSWWWISSRNPGYSAEWFLFPLAVLGLAVSLLSRFATKRERLLSRVDSLLLLTLFWIIWSSVDFQGAPDWIPLLPFLAVWAAVGTLSAADASGTLLPASRNGKTRARLALSGVLVVLLYIDAFTYESHLTLREQIGYVSDTVGEGATMRSFVAFDAEEFYIFTGTRSPIQFTRLAGWVDRMANARIDGGTAAVARELIRLDPDIVIMRRTVWGSLRDQLEPLVTGRELVWLTVPGNYEPVDPNRSGDAPEILIYTRPGTTDDPVHTAHQADQEIGY